MSQTDNVCDFVVRSAFGSSAARSVVVIGSQHYLRPAPPSCIDRSFDSVAEFSGCEAQTVIITDALDGLEADRLTSALASFRNRLIPRIVFLPLIEAGLGVEQALNGLGFVLSGQLDSRQIWGYELSSDNIAREWNNTEHWANPQNFDSGRW